MASIVDMSKHFTTKDLLRYTAPSMVMMVFTSIYSIVDGLFISNFAGKTAFAAVNLIMPFIMIMGTVGFMVGTGGGALVGFARGSGDTEKANRWFSLVIYFAVIVGVILALLAFFLMEPVARFLGASEEMLPICVLYGRINMISLPCFILQYAFQPLFSTAGKPKIGLAIVVASGCANMVLDCVFVGLLGWGVAGAAAATVASELTGGLVSLFYFLAPNKSALRLGKTKLEWKVLARTCVNGSSELMANIAFNIVGMLYNWQLMRLMGEDGVSAYGVIMYASMIFAALLMGYSVGSAPLMSFQHGAKNNEEKRSLFRHSLAIIAVGGVLMLASAELLAPEVAEIFTGYDQELFDITIQAFRTYSLAFLIMGFSIYGSSLFTSLGNGVISALISFMRTLVFECGAVILLPLLLGADGIWLSVVVAECASIALTFTCIAKLGQRYGLLRVQTE